MILQLSISKAPTRIAGASSREKMTSGSRIINDEISGWLEDFIRPELDKLHREFLWQYLCIYDQWAQFHKQNPGIDDQTSLMHMVRSAEEALRDLASRSPTRLWLSVIRSLPLPVVAHITMPLDGNHLMELLKIASAAACLYGDRKFRMLEGENALAVTPEWLESFKKRLAVDVTRFLGAAHTWYYARSWYRIVGKGGMLIPPQKVDLKVARESLDALPPYAIMLVPSIAFTNEEQIMPQVLDYDRRSREAAGASISGVLVTTPASDKRETDPLSWWKLAIPKTVMEPLTFSVFYPLQNITLITTSYCLIPEELAPQLDRLAPFESLMLNRLGIAFKSFGLCCRAVAAALRHQTGFMELRPLPSEPRIIRFRAEHQSLEIERLAASFLFSVMHRGLLRAPRQSWIDTLTRLVSEGGETNPRQTVETFIRLFTRIRQLDPDLEPSLFLETDPQTLALDLISMSEFFELCLRKVTSVDNAPTPNARRGAIFEQAVWQFLSRRLKIKLLVALNSHFHEGAVQGEIDVAFLIDGLIVVLECKSWQKRLDYFRGDRKSIEQRHKQLRRIIEKQLARNVALLLHHLGPQFSGHVLTFICVAGPEFIMQGYPSLWYGSTQRVLTPQEIVDLIYDTPRWHRTIEAAKASA